MRILLLAIMMIFASSAFAGLYKWVDDDGNIHYSQKRPANQQFRQIKAPPPAPENSKPLYNSSVVPSGEKGNTAASETEKNNKIRAENCAKAKKSLTNYQIHRRMRDKDGNVSVIGNKERAKNIESSKQAVSNYCD